jgi:hypothetical protein
MAQASICAIKSVIKREPKPDIAAVTAAIVSALDAVLEAEGL